MKPDYLRPTTLEQALTFAASPGAVLLAGGTDVLVRLRDGLFPIVSLVSLRDLPELRGSRVDRQGRWVLGASTTHEWAAGDPEFGSLFPALATACRSIGSPAVRSSATIVGNICTAAPSADSAGPLLAYAAEVMVAEHQPDARGASGAVVERAVSLKNLFIGPGRTGLVPGQVVTALRLRDPGPHGAAFRKLSRRRAMDIALVSVTALVWLAPDGSCLDLRVALGAVAPTPVVLPDATEKAHGRRRDASLLDEIARSAMAASRPVSDMRASAGYRRVMVGTLTRAAVEEAWCAAEHTVGSAGGGAR